MNTREIGNKSFLNHAHSIRLLCGTVKYVSDIADRRKVFLRKGTSTHAIVESLWSHVYIVQYSHYFPRFSFLLSRQSRSPGSVGPARFGAVQYFLKIHKLTQFGLNVNLTQSTPETETNICSVYVLVIAQWLVQFDKY